MAAEVYGEIDYERIPYSLPVVQSRISQAVSASDSILVDLTVDLNGLRLLGQLNYLVIVLYTKDKKYYYRGSVMNRNAIQISGTFGVNIAAGTKYVAYPDIARYLETQISERAPSPDLFVKDVNVTTTAGSIDTDTTFRSLVILTADIDNTAIIYIGTSISQLYPLRGGDSISVKDTTLSRIYARAASGTQTLHVLAGGSSI